MSSKSQHKIIDEVGTRLKIERIKRGLSQAQLADRVGISTNYVSLIENGRKTPSLMTLSKFAAQLEISTASLMADENLEETLKQILSNHDLETILRGLHKIVRSIETKEKSYGLI